MNINDLVKEHPVLERISSKVVKEFYPPQEEAFRTGFLNGKNLLLASPTSSGKTLVAQIAMLVNKSKGKSLYLVPLRSLAHEKFEDFSKFYEGILSVSVSTGDLTRSDDRLKNSDLIICSYEKFDSLLRHKASWIKDVSLVVFDEVHLIDDTYRGPLIEVLITRLKKMNKQIIGLSATVNNHESLGEWINACTVKSAFRPVKLIEGALSNGVVSFKNDERLINASDLSDLCLNTVRSNKQCLVFVNNRRSTESTAEKLGLELRNTLSRDERAALSVISRKVLNALPSPTVQCKRLSECVKNGTAFNHAGLVSSQKILIESAFRMGLIKVISCTTVLAYGVSLPAYLVVLRDLKRFSNDGMNYIPVSEYLQIAGRAGRSGYDVEGASVIITSNNPEKDLVWNEYLCSKPSDIISKLGVESALMSHSLALVCDGSCSSVNDLALFFNDSFFGHEYGSDFFLNEKIERVINDLIDFGLVKEVNSRLVPSRLGSRVNELYINPLSAKRISEGLTNLKINPEAFLHLACSCSEIKNLNMKRNDFSLLLEGLAINQDKLMIPVPNPFDYEYDDYLRSFKTALMLNSWINEASEDELLDSYSIPPGELHSVLSNLEWILYSIGEIAVIQGIKGVKEFINGLIIRVKYGIKSELLTLVSLKGIGRARARKLFVSGFKTVSDLRSAGKDKLSKILGPKTAYALLKELN